MYVYVIGVIIGSGNGLVSSDTKPLLESVMTSRKWDYEEHEYVKHLRLKLWLEILLLKCYFLAQASMG